MEIGAYPALIDPTPLTRRPEPVVRGQSTPAPSAEQVLQGELLQRQQPAGQNPRKNQSTWTARRREDHPAFQRRHANDSYQQRRAIDAYQAQTATAQVSTRQGASVDYFA